MDFKELNLKQKFLEDKKSFVYTDNDNISHQIFVFKTISSRDKNDLLQITFQKSEINNQYNELLLEIFFHLNILYLYTDINFSEEDRLDQMELYDILENNGIIDNVIAIMEENQEYTNLRNLLIQQLKRREKYKGSAAAIIESLVLGLPKNIDVIQNLMKDWNPEDFQQVINFAQAANGNRPIEADEE